MSDPTQQPGFDAYLMDALSITDGGGKRPAHVEFLSHEQAMPLAASLSSPANLIAKLIYACGLRLVEVLSLRVRDLDMETGLVYVRNRRGDGNRSLPIPQTLIPAIRNHLSTIHDQYGRDMASGFAGVEAPEIRLRDNYPQSPVAGRSWAWQWVFPSPRMSVTAEGKRIRTPFRESQILGEIRRGAALLGLEKKVTPRTLRHSYAIRLLKSGCDIQRLRELMGLPKLATPGI